MLTHRAALVPLKAYGDEVRKHDRAFLSVYCSLVWGAMAK
jgi:hypothetical protein